MNKEKLKHLPFNLFFSIQQGILVYLLLTIVLGVDDFRSYAIAFVAYFYDAVLNARFDYIESKIK